jgi:hypothetical protein
LIVAANIIAATRSAREARAIAHIKTLAGAQGNFFCAANRFALFDELFARDFLAKGQFIRGVPGNNGAPSNGATEVISDGDYDYSFRYTADLQGYSMDADPKSSLRSSQRFFRYRANRSVAGGSSGSSEIILVAQPRLNLDAPPSSAYKPFNPN